MTAPLIRTYQAVSSSDGLTYTWQSPTIDVVGAGYTGPGLPLDILQISHEGVAGVDGTDGVVPTWHDLLDVDYSVLPDQTFSADGAVTVGGVGYVVESLANAYEGLTIGITNGLGMRLPSPAAAQVSATRLTGSFDVTRVGFPLPSVCTNNVPVRAAFRLKSWETGLAVNLNPTIAIAYPSATNICCQVASMKVLAGSNPGTFTVWDARRSVHGTVVSVAADKASASGTNILGIYAPSGVGGAKPLEFMAGIESVTPISDLDGLVTIGTSSGQTDTGMDPATRGQAQNWFVYLCLQAVTGGPRSAYVDRLRVQAFY